MGIKYKVKGLTDVGTVKAINEDAYYISQKVVNGENVVFGLVADGMGGIPGGNNASTTVRNIFENWFTNEIVISDENVERALITTWRENIHKANEIITLGGTTLTMILLYEGTYYVANIGDSRIYHFSEGTLYQITKDHSWAAERLIEGKSADYIENHPYRNKITRCIGLGNDDTAKADFFSSFYLPGDFFLLCSDGLRHLLHTEEIITALTDESLKVGKKISKMIELVKARRERDNITAVLIEVLKE